MGATVGIAVIWGLAGGLKFGADTTKSGDKRDNVAMKRSWLFFTQTVTILLAAYFVVLTLKPDWLSATSFIDKTARAPLVKRGLLPDSAATDGSLRAAAQTAAPAVVSIQTSKAGSAPTDPRLNDPLFRFFFGDPESDSPDTDEASNLGSGVIVSASGYVLTNNHVVESADEIQVTLADGRRTLASVLGTDPDTDLAVLKIGLSDLPVLTIGDSNALYVGDLVLAIGNPFGVGQTVTSGIVSALGRSQLGINTYENFIQTDAAINPGNSGGALVNSRGDLIGINTAIYSRSGGSLGIGFAIPVSLAEKVLQDIVAKGMVTRGWIGIEPQTLSAEMASSFGLGDGKGVLVSGVLQNGPAARAGMRPGDIIKQVGETKVATVEGLLAAVSALAPDQETAITVWRQGQDRRLAIRPGQRPKPAHGKR